MFNGLSHNSENGGVKDENGEICYVIGVLASIRKQLGKKDGDTLRAVI